MKHERVGIDNLLPTASVNKEKVEKWASDFQNGNEMPPIKYIIDPETGQKYIVDGNSKWFSSLLRGDTVVNAEEWTDLPADVKDRFLQKIKS